MGFIRGYADRMNLAAMVPRGGLSSTGHVLASVKADAPEFLVYAPSEGNFTVDLSAIDGPLAQEWMNPATGERTSGPTVTAGKRTTFTPTFRGDAVLYLKRHL